ncbi:MAG: LysR family transcriptional regulator [Rudaea sp.]
MTPPKTRSALRLRLALRNGRAFGPGKADLLDGIATLGSIAAAGRALNMSYKRAWQLVEDLNTSFKSPLVVASKGGGQGGGAKLTMTGHRVLALYRRVEAKSQTAAATELAALHRLTHSPPGA